MTSALPSVFEAILNLEFKKPGKSGSARLPRSMKLGNSTGQWLGTFRAVLHLVLPISCVYKEFKYRE